MNAAVIDKPQLQQQQQYVTPEVAGKKRPLLMPYNNNNNNKNNQSNAPGRRQPPHHRCVEQNASRTATNPDFLANNGDDLNHHHHHFHQMSTSFQQQQQQQQQQHQHAYNCNNYSDGENFVETCFDGTAAASTNDYDDAASVPMQHSPQQSATLTQQQQAPHQPSSSVATPLSSRPPSVRYAPPATRLRDIIGHAPIKLRLDEILLPLALPVAVTRRVYTGIRAQPTSVLLYGPPGCGKTQLAAALAGEAQAAFMSVGPSDILSKFVGESEAAVRAVFCQAVALANCMESKCAVVFWDEIDALGASRGGSSGGGGSTTASGGGGDSEGCSRRILAELLLQFNKLGATNNSNNHQNNHGNNDTVEEDADNDVNYDDDEATTTTTATSTIKQQQQQQQQQQLPTRVLMIAATNRPEDCDPALLRRFGLRLYVGYPTETDRRKILKRLLRGIAHNLTRADLTSLAAATVDWSGSELEHLAREAAMAPVRECLQQAARLKRATKRPRRTTMVTTTSPLSSSALSGTNAAGITGSSHNHASSALDHSQHLLQNSQIPDSATTEENDDDSDEDDLDDGETNYDSSHTDDALEHARETLLTSLEQLRPVTLQDFAAAIDFTLAQASPADAAALLSPNTRAMLPCHSTTSSSSDLAASSRALSMQQLPQQHSHEHQEAKWQCNDNFSDGGGDDDGIEKSDTL